MGLLDGSAMDIGLGLLQESGPAYTPRSWGRGVMTGLLNRRDRKTAAQQNELNMLALAQARREAESAEALEGLISQLAPEQQAIARANPSYFFTPQPTVKMTTAGELGLQNVNPATPVEVKYDGRGNVEDYNVLPGALQEENRFPGTGVEISALNAFISSLPEGKQKAGLIELARQRLQRAQTVNTPEGTYIYPGYDLDLPTATNENPELARRAVEPETGEDSNLPDRYVKKRLDQSTKTAQYVAGNLTTLSAQIQRLEAIEDFDPTALKNVIGRLPGGNVALDSNMQQYNALADEWATNIVFLRSGATARQEEKDSARSNYFPQPGDKPETIALKKRMRISAEIAAFKKGITDGRVPEDAQTELNNLEQRLEAAGGSPENAPINNLYNDADEIIRKYIEQQGVK